MFFSFLLSFAQASASVCHHRTTTKLSFTNSKVWSLYPTSSGTNLRWWCYIEVHPCCLFLLQARNTPLHLAAASGLLSCVEVGTCMQVGLQYHSWILYYSRPQTSSGVYTASSIMHRILKVICAGVGLGSGTNSILYLLLILPCFKRE